MRLRTDSPAECRVSGAGGQARAAPQADRHSRSRRGSVNKRKSTKVHTPKAGGSLQSGDLIVKHRVEDVFAEARPMQSQLKPVAVRQRDQALVHAPWDPPSGGGAESGALVFCIQEHIVGPTVHEQCVSVHALRVRDKSDHQNSRKASDERERVERRARFGRKSNRRARAAPVLCARRRTPFPLGAPPFGER